MTDESLDQQALLELLGFVQLPSVPEPTLAQMDAHEQFARGKQAAERGWKPAARKTLESVQDLLMGALGFPQNDSRSSLAGEMLSAAVPVVGGLKAIRIKNPIKAWHGTPHDFDEFRMSQIGTGEGAQAYGHGLYFAENPGVAKSYRDNLTDSMMRVRQGFDYQPYDLNIAGQILKASDGTPAGFMRVLEQERAGTRDLGVQQVLDRIKSAVRGGDYSIPTKSGRMYEVNLHVDPDELLDWDAPLSQQSAAAKSRVLDTPELRKKSEQLKWDEMDLSATNDSKLYKQWGDGRGPLAKAARKAIQGTATPREIREVNQAFREYRDEFPDYLTYLEQSRGTTVGEAIQSAGRTPDLSQRLSDAGIPGIKYWDQGSRAAQEGTRNYVMWDENRIELVKKFGIALALGAGLISQAEAEQLKAQGYR